jgi:hypothetical protein
MFRVGDDDQENLRLDYAETVSVWRHLVDVRFKLLALVPTLSAIGVGVVGREEPSYDAVVVAAVALVSIVAIATYDLRNSMFHDTAIHRAKTLESRLGLRRASSDLPSRQVGVCAPKTDEGGYFTDRPRGKLKLFGLFPVWHDLALWLVYSISAGGWAAVGGYALAGRQEWRSPWTWGVAQGALVALLLFGGLVRYDKQWDRLKKGDLFPPGGPEAEERQHVPNAEL